MSRTRRAVIAGLGRGTMPAAPLGSARPGTAFSGPRTPIDRAVEGRSAARSLRSSNPSTACAAPPTT